MLDIRFDIHNKIGFGDLLLVASGKLNRLNIDNFIEMREREREEVDDFEYDFGKKGKKVEYESNTKNRSDNHFPSIQGQA